MRGGGDAEHIRSSQRRFFSAARHRFRRKDWQCEQRMVEHWVSYCNRRRERREER